MARRLGSDRKLPRLPKAVCAPGSRPNLSACFAPLILPCPAPQAFYASVEERDNPALKAVPMAVGGMGMITTANYTVTLALGDSRAWGFNALHVCI